MPDNQIRSEFQYHELNQAGIDACTQIRQGFSALLTQIEAIIPAGRDRALVVTKLQEACSAAVRGAATMTAHQRPVMGTVAWLKARILTALREVERTINLGPNPRRAALVEAIEALPDVTKLRALPEVDRKPVEDRLPSCSDWKPMEG